MNTQVLKEIGLTDNEIKIYLCLIKHGPCLVNNIVLETGLNRTHIYDRLEKLIEKGIANYVIKENRKYFNVSSAKNLLNYIEEKKRHLEENKNEITKILPELEKLKTKKEEVIVEVFKGIEGTKTLLNHTIEVGETLRIFPWTGLLYGRMPAFYRNWIKRRAKAKVKRKLLASEDKRKLMQEKLALTEIRYFPPDFNFPSSTWVYGNFTVIYLALDEITLIRIENETVAKIYTNFFESMWKISKK